jgi:hypothetical protein
MAAGAVAALLSMSAILSAGPVSAVAATGGWAKINSGTTQNLYSVAVQQTCATSCILTVPTEVWAVGAGGTIVRSSDSGAHFAAIASGTTQDLFGIGFVDSCTAPSSQARSSNPHATTAGTCIYVAGANGTLRVSTNDGANWCDVNQDAGAVRLGGHFVPDSGTTEIAGAAGTVLFGGDSSQVCPNPPSGAAFKKQATGDTHNLFSDAFASSFRWQVGDAGTILGERVAQPGSTCNPGQTGMGQFDRQNSGTTADLRGVDGGRQGDVFVVGKAGTIIHTSFKGATDYTDGVQCAPISATWAGQQSGTTNDLNDIASFGASNLPGPTNNFVVGNAGTILQSTDNKSWTSHVSGVCVNLNSVAMGVTNSDGAVTLTSAYAVGDGGTILRYDPAAASATATSCATSSQAPASVAPKLPAAGQPSGPGFAGAWVMAALWATAAAGLGLAARQALRHRRSVQARER